MTSGCKERCKTCVNGNENKILLQTVVAIKRGWDSKWWVGGGMRRGRKERCKTCVNGWGVKYNYTDSGGSNKTLKAEGGRAKRVGEVA